MVKAKKWILAKQFEGFPKDSDLKLVEEELPDLKDGEILCEAVYLSVDPYMRPYMRQFPEGSIMIGQQVARVAESKNPDWKVGSLALVNVGWRTHTVLNADEASKKSKLSAVPLLQRVTPDLGELSPSYALGAIGMPGATAYFGIHEILKPKAGETLFVNAAAGAVGSVVGQIAKILGCRVIGCASTKEKCDWLRELGFDYVYNYKECDNSAALKEGAPNGVDCVFENVGGEFCTTVIRDHMNRFGRMALCGSITTYNDKEGKPGEAPYPWSTLIFKQLKLEGFVVYNYWDKYPEALAALAKWTKEGKLKIREHVTEGFENMPRAFLELFTSTNLGKAVVKV